MIGKYAFSDTDIIFKNKAHMKYFTRYLSAHILTTSFLSEEW